MKEDELSVPFLAGLVQKRRDKARFDHERAQAARTDAAGAYGKALHTLRYVHPSYSKTIATSPDGELKLRTEIDESLGALGVVAALGWNEDVRNTCSSLTHAFEAVVMTNWAYVGAIRKNHDATTFDMVEKKWDKAWSSLEAFRRTIAGEPPAEDEEAPGVDLPEAG